jgi:beta-galactosidase/beta-glucuronidase
MLHGMTDALMPPASAQDGRYPRPQLVRPRWLELSGEWRFAFDDADEGVSHGWQLDPDAIRGTIIVPFPPESVASGIGDTDYHRVLWYRRTVTPGELEAVGHGAGRRALLHFGAVDYRAEVWANGSLVARHEGGHTPFTAELPMTQGDIDIVVRVEDDPHDLAQPRGKQDWERHPHVVWYDRTSGIWQPVWLESVPRQHVTRLSWRSDVARAQASIDLEVAEDVAPGTRLRVALRLSGTLLAEHTVLVTTRRSTVVLDIPVLRNGQTLDRYLWSPEHPVLVDADLALEAPGGEPDVMASYLGIRDVATSAGRFLLNGRPHHIRGVLSQGYWPTSHLAAPSADALRAEVELIKQLGFTTVRLHQKIEDPRLLYWADRLGLLVWAEMPSGYEFSDTAAARIVAEWTDVVRRDSSHPSIVVWVPVNESWGVQHVATEPRQQDLVRALYHLTHALDGSRLVVSNDGWEHTRSDLLTVHDYENDAARLLVSYEDARAVRRSVEQFAANGRRMLVGTEEEAGLTAAAPVVLSEFGGVSIEHDAPDSWGYRVVPPHQFEQHLSGLLRAAAASEGLAGWCYTQLTDTGQETNGLVDAQRIPKLPVDRIRALVLGDARGRADSPVFADPAAREDG